MQLLQCFFFMLKRFHDTRTLTQDSFLVNRTRVAYAVCTFCHFLGGWVTQAPFSLPNSIKALEALLIGRLYFWLSSSRVFAA